MWTKLRRYSIVAAGVASLLAVITLFSPVGRASAAPVYSKLAQAATSTPNPTATQSLNGQVFVSCRYYGPYDREFDLQLEQGHGGAPTVDVTLGLVTGGTQTDHFVAYSHQYRGPYLNISADAHWPDQASGYGGATCGYAIPTETPTSTSTPDYSLTPTATHLPREPQPTDTPAPPPVPTSPATPILSLTDTPLPPTATLPPATPIVIATPPLETTPFPPAPTPAPLLITTPLSAPSATPMSNTGGHVGTIPGLPRTGQTNDMWLWLLGITIAALALGYTLRRPRRSAKD